MVYDNHLIHPYHLSQPIYSIEENLSWTNLAQYSLVQPITAQYSTAIPILAILSRIYVLFGVHLPV